MLGFGKYKRTCFRNPGSVRNNCAPSATVSVKSRPPPFPCPPFGSEVRAKVTRFSKRAHWKVPSLLKSTWVSRVLKLASRSVNNRFATYGYATSRNRKSGSVEEVSVLYVWKQCLDLGKPRYVPGLKVMQMPSCVSKDRMTRLNRSGIRMGYWYTSWLNAPVTVRKLKFARLAVRASCQMDSSAVWKKINVSVS